MATMSDVQRVEGVSLNDVLQNLMRHVNCLSEDNRNTRKRAMEGIKKETLQRKYDKTLIEGVLNEIQKPVLKLLSDPVEKCRELAITYIHDSLKIVPQLDNFLIYLVPVLVQRLGQQDIIEPSEELRLQLVLMLSDIVNISQKKIAPYLDDFIKILHRTINDPFAEVKKESCRCARNLAKAVPEDFHMQSESLIKPLLLAISHQHSKVRVEVIYAIGDVIQYGNNKSVEDVVSHLAQRLFDQTPVVRAAVTQVVGEWLLDLRDRYSFHNRLIPLLLTSITDEIPDIRQQADSLWHDVGIKYEQENEDELKDKQDFLTVDPDEYHPADERPNLGCRTLVYRHFSSIISGLTRDLTDWVASTRIKSAELLYTLLLNEEDNVTQHLDKVLSGLFKAALDEEKQVVKYVVKCAELLGFFVKTEIWCKMALQQVAVSQSVGTLIVLAALIRGSKQPELKPYLQQISDVISDPGISTSVDTVTQEQLLNCVGAIIEVSKSDCKEVSATLFITLTTVLAIQRHQAIRDRCHSLLEDLSLAQGLDGKQRLFELHTRHAIESLKSCYASWTQHSTERLVFDTLIMESGPVVGELLEDIMPVLKANLHPDKDAEVRLKFFSLLSRLMMNAGGTVDSQQRFGDFAVLVVKEMIIPNCIWRAGRTAASIRTTAVSCLWALLQSGVFTVEKLTEVMEELMTQLRSTLEDDNQSTRLVTCRVIMHVFRTTGTRLDQDRLHNMYPDLLKRLDDGNDDVRVAMCQTFLAYLDCFQEGYDVSLYRAHLEDMYRGLLVHLDDPEHKIQDAVLEVLQRAAHLDPGMLAKEVESVKHKHRSTKFCDQILDSIRALSIKSS